MAENETPTSSAPEAGKPRVAKGPIRTEAVVPFAILIALVVAYFVLFFDLHLRRGLEAAATQANGAEVNIGGLRTSFIFGSLRIDRIEVTNAEKPERNLVEVGDVQFKFLWDALLRGKFVIDNAAIHDVGIDTPRKHIGKVLPPPPPAVDGPSLKDKAVARFKEEIAKDDLGDIGAILDGLDPTGGLKDLGKLKSAARVQELQAELARKEAEWSKTIDSLPDEEDLAALQEKITSIKSGGSPAEIAAKLKLADEAIKEVGAKADAIRSAGGNLAGDIGSFGKSVAGIDDLVRQDRSDIQSKLKMPALDAKALARQLFGNTIMNTLAQAEKYVGMARQYMPVKGAKEAKEAKEAGKEGKEGKVWEAAPVRARGRNYEFGHPNSYPMFWLKRAELSTSAQGTPFGGAVEGKIFDVTSSPAAIGRPAVFQLTGDFPGAQVRKASATIVLDHTTDIPYDNIKVSVESYATEGLEISRSDSLKFGIAKAEGSLGLEGVLEGREFSLLLNNTFRKVDYEIAASSKLLESTLKSVVKDLPAITVNGSAKGTWSDVDVSVRSNLAEALQRGFDRQLQARLAEARAKIDALIQEQIGKQRAELTRRFDATKAKYLARIDALKTRSEALKKQADAKVAEVKSKASGGAAEKLKRKLKF